MRYRRTDLTGWEPLARSAQLPDPDFDCITKCWYDVEGTREQRKMDLLPADGFRRLAADEENFLDRRANRLVATEPIESKPETLLGNRG